MKRSVCSFVCVALWVSLVNLGAASDAIAQVYGGGIGSLSGSSSARERFFERGRDEFDLEIRRLQAGTRILEEDFLFVEPETLPSYWVPLLESPCEGSESPESELPAEG